MKCNTHNNEANGICPSCGKALCPECSVVNNSTRNACSEECLSNLKTHDEAAYLSVTKAKKSLTANVMFLRFIGIVFIIVGIIPLFLWGINFLTAFLSVMGISFFIGGQIYASALTDKENL